MSDADPIKDNPKDPLVLRCIKALAAVDWKAMAIVLAALAGFGGAIWNRVDALVEKALQARTQQGAYDLLAGKLDELALRMEKVEKAHAIDAPLRAPVPVPPPPRTPEPKPEEHGALPVDGDGVTSVTAAGEPPPAPVFKSARLPSFQQVQQAAADDAMPAMLEAHAVKAE